VIAVALVSIVALLVIFTSLKTLAVYERGVVYRLGRVLPDAVGPGLVLTIPMIDRLVRVSVAEQKIDLPRVAVTTTGGRSEMDFSIAFRVLDPVRATTEVSEYREAVTTLARNTIESGSGEADWHEISARVRSQLDEAVRPWGIQIRSVKVNAKRFGTPASR